MKSIHDLQSVQPTEQQALKPGALRDDFFEDVIHRDYLSHQGANESTSLRLTPIFDLKKKRGRLITSGKKELQDVVDQVIKGRNIEHEKVTITAYPGDEGFQAEEFKKIAAPQLARTLKALRERLGSPIDALENVAMSIEQDVQTKLDAWFNPPKEITEPPKSDTPTQ